MDLDKDFNLMVGLRIREVREVLHMTREQFSERCDISDSFLAAIENGKKSITTKTLFKICSNTNISADYIIFGKQHGYQMDMIVEMLGELDAPLRDSAVRILSEYIQSMDYVKTKQENQKSS